MAICTAHTAPRYLLDLSSEEAECVMELVGGVVGNCETTARKYSDAVYDALSDAGVEVKKRRFCLPVVSANREAAE